MKKAGYTILIFSIVAAAAAVLFTLILPSGDDEALDIEVRVVSVEPGMRTKPTQCEVESKISMRLLVDLNSFRVWMPDNWQNTDRERMDVEFTSDDQRMLAAWIRYAAYEAAAFPIPGFSSEIREKRWLPSYLKNDITELDYTLFILGIVPSDIHKARGKNRTCLKRLFVEKCDLRIPAIHVHSDAVDAIISVRKVEGTIVGYAYIYDRDKRLNGMFIVGFCTDASARDAHSMLLQLVAHCSFDKK